MPLNVGPPTGGKPASATLPWSTSRLLSTSSTSAAPWPRSIPSCSTPCVPRASSSISWCRRPIWKP
ncbi:unnamed protein product [Linum tenue]|uniref:Uncharacterized protein n=1 Tax=Linum tenue TaxID=586396 RepID=A0AAV0PI52_9ROSI|nr:unnamed protein product [Linum tenue]